MTVGELLQHTAARLAAPELLSEDPVQEARELVAHALGVLPADLPGRANTSVESGQHGEFMLVFARQHSNQELVFRETGAQPLEHRQID